MKPYLTYKDSGIAWIGKIPIQWRLKKIKHTTYVKGRVGWKGLTSDEFLEEGYSYLITGTDFNNGQVSWDTCYHIDQERYEEDPYIQLKEDDLLITKDGTIGKVALVKDLDGYACLNSGIFVVRPNTGDYITKFMYWVLVSNVFFEFNEFTKSGSTIKHLYQNVFVEFQFPTPPSEEQTAIANFLDHKTTQIDLSIEKRRELIGLLKEHRTALINEAVTKGINSNAPMKNSGIEWIGDIPEHWIKNKLKRLAEIKGRIGFRGYTTNDLVPKGQGALTLGASHIDLQGEIILTSPVFISWEKYYESPEIMISKKDILIVQRGSTCGKIGYIKNDIEKATINPSLVLIKNIAINNQFLFYSLKSKLVSSEVDLALNSTAIPMLSQEQIGNFRILAPPLHEQQQIVDYIETETTRIDKEIEATQKEIDLLKEYRQSLIAEAVTGRLTYEITP